MYRRTFMGAAALASIGYGVAAEGQRRLSKDESVFRVGRAWGVRPGQFDKATLQMEFDIAVVEFDDAGAFARPGQLDAATECIKAARERTPAGALVVVFIHGWHHNARWLERIPIMLQHALHERRIWRHFGGQPSHELTDAAAKPHPRN
jgi:hypothetical protein